MRGYSTSALDIGVFWLPISVVSLLSGRLKDEYQVWLVNRSALRPASSNLAGSQGRERPPLWMDETLHHFETLGNHSYLQENHQKPGFLRWCEMDFVHPHY